MKLLILAPLLFLAACDRDKDDPIPSPKPIVIEDEVIGYGELILECKAPPTEYPLCFKDCVFNYRPPTEPYQYTDASRPSFVSYHESLSFDPVTDNFNDFSQYLNNQASSNLTAQFMVRAGVYNAPTLIIYGPYCGFGAQSVTFHIDSSIVVEDGGITEVEF